MQQSHITNHHLIDGEHSHHHHQRHRHRLLLRKFFTDFRRQSSIHDYQLPNTLSLAVTDEEAGDLSATRLSISNSLTSVHKQCEDEDNEAADKLLEIGRVAAWAVCFEKMLADDLGLHVFTEFLKKEFSQENIQFWIECEKFKKLSDQEQIKTKANQIWKTYLHDTDDGSCRINIDSRTRQECEQALQNQQAHSQIFEKAQSQIFQLMKYDSYSRFLKSNMYKECIMSEMEGKPIPYSKQLQVSSATSQSQPTRTSSHQEERSKTIDCLAKLKEDEKKEKKRSPLIPWTKAFIKWKRLSVKRDTSMSNDHHQQQSSNSSLNENLSASISPKSTSVELSSVSTLIKIPSASSSSSFFLANSALSPLIPIGNLSKLSKNSLSVHSQDSPSISPRSRVETPHDYLETKFCFDQPVASPIDPSRFCRFIFPDSTSAVIRVGNSSQTIRHAIHYLFAKRGITWYRTELFSLDQQPIDIGEFLSNLAGREIRVERRILIRWDFPTNLFCIRCDPKRTLQQIVQPILDKLQTSSNKFLFFTNDCSIPLNLNESSGAYDNQRLFAFNKTSSGNPDMSTRDRFKILNDIFDMIPENDEDIQFDQYGILKSSKIFNAD